MSKTEPCELHRQSAALEAAIPGVNRLLLTLQDAGLSARLQVQVTAAGTVPAPAPWPPELGEGKARTRGTCGSLGMVHPQAPAARQEKP